MVGMGQLSRRNDERTAMASVAGSRVWLETCSVCGRPVTIVAATKPTDPHCAGCGAAEPALDADA
jgi:hypothetical protein